MRNTGESKQTDVVVVGGGVVGLAIALALIGPAISRVEADPDAPVPAGASPATDEAATPVPAQVEDGDETPGRGDEKRPDADNGRGNGRGDDKGQKGGDKDGEDGDD